MIIRVKVKPNSGEQSVQRIFLPQIGVSSSPEEVYYVKLKSLADEGRANLELVKVLKEHFGKQVKIKSGFNSRTKFVEILE
jgi:uncharacterized protein (TIGR00251 family)